MPLMRRPAGLRDADDDQLETKSHPQVHSTYFSSTTSASSSGSTSSSDCPAYFDSLHQLHQHFDHHQSSHQPQTRAIYQGQLSDSHHQHIHPHSPQSIPPRLIVTHDFKGGYADKPFERGYSFEWLSSTDIFIYFSHRRVTIPPADWITAARTHQTTILGTLIFEHAASIPDIDLLLSGPPSTTVPEIETRYYLNLKPHPQASVDCISTYFADRLIDLAAHLGFQGWLLNFEADLSITRPSTSAATAHAIKIWVEYLRLEGERRIGPTWEVCWYDSLSHHDGRLQWRSRLDPLDNLPFLSASSSLFLDYHWKLNFPQDTQLLIDKLQEQLNRSTDSSATSPASTLFSNLTSDPMNSLRKKITQRALNLKTDLYFGVDVYGRGCPYGGGFSSWKAADAVCRTGFSVALFAPGWTWESHHLHPARDRTINWWASWWAEERYLWAGLNTTCPTVLENTYVDACRIAQEAGQRTPPVRGTSNSEPLHLRPLLSLFEPLGRSTPYWSNSFYTNYSLGSGGNGYWVQGFQVMGNSVEWTDMASSFPKNDLSIGGAQRQSCEQPLIRQAGPAINCAIIDQLGWYGSGSVSIVDESTPQVETPGLVWMNSLAVCLKGPTDCRIVWRAQTASETSALGIALDAVLTSPSASTITSTMSPSAPPILTVGATDVLTISETRVVELSGGWYETSCMLTPTTTNAVLLKRFGLTIAGTSRFDHNLGQLSISPALPEHSDESANTNLIAINLAWREGDKVVHWNHQPKHWYTQTVMYILYLIQGTADAERTTFLGTVRDAFIGDLTGPQRHYHFNLGKLVIDSEVDSRSGGGTSVMLKRLDIRGELQIIGIVKLPDKHST